MRLLKHLCASIALVAIIAAHPVAAQPGLGMQVPSVLVGVTGALSSNVHTGPFSYFREGDEECDCPEFRDGTGIGYQAGVAIRYQTSQLFAIDSRVVFDARPAEFEEQLPEALVLLPGTNEIVTQSAVARSSVIYTLATVDLLATARVPVVGDWVTLAISAGPTLSTVTEGTITQTQQLTSPPNARMTNPDGLPTEDEGRRLIFNRDREIPRLEGTRASLKGGAAVELRPFASVLFRAGIYYDRGMTGVRTTDDWKVHSTLFQIDALVELYACVPQLDLLVAL